MICSEASSDGSVSENDRRDRGTLLVATGPTLVMYFRDCGRVVPLTAMGHMSILRSTLLLLSYLILQGSLTAQLRKPSGSGWNFGVNAGVGMGYRTLINHQSSVLTAATIMEREAREEPRIAYGASFRCGRQISRRFGLEFGLGYFQTGWQYEVDMTALTFGDQIDPRRGFIYATDDVIPVEAKLINVVHYLELPMAATLTFGKGRVRSVTAVGISPAYLLTASDAVDYKFEDGSTERSRYAPSTPYQNFNLFSFLSTGLSVQSKRGLEFRLQPTVRYGLLEIIDLPISARVFNGTVDLGVRIAL